MSFSGRVGIGMVLFGFSVGMVFFDFPVGVEKLGI